jgi:DNA invertase Pin-like site-specific DNA recombinase
MQRAYAYLRVSGKGQVDGDGFVRQLEAINRHAKAHDLRIERVFREEGVSGTTESLFRPAFAEMLAAMRADRVQVVVIEKLDRLARDLMVQEATIADFTKHGLTLVSVAEPDLMANDPTRILVRQMLGAVAQYDKTQIVLKLRVARERKRHQNGRCEGRKPFGARPGESQLLDRMRALRAHGMSFDRIAARFNAEGVPTRTPGKRWRGGAVNQMLKRIHASRNA